MSSRELSFRLKVAGVALLSFSGFGVLQLLGFDCITSSPALPSGTAPLSFACFFGVDPLVLPFLLGIGACFLIAGSLSEQRVLARGFPWAPPGVGFVALGGAVLEIASTYLVGAWGFFLSPLTPALLAGGLGLLAWGGWSWRRSRAGDTSDPPRLRAARSERAAEARVPPARPKGGNWAWILVALGTATGAFGLFALVIGLVSKDGFECVPAYLCYDPGLEPSTSVPIVILGAVLLSAGASGVSNLRRQSSPGTRWRLAFLAAAGGVLEAAVALVLFGNHNGGWTVAVSAPTLLVAGGLMVAKGASFPSAKPNRLRLLIVFGTAWLGLVFANLWYLVSTRDLPVIYQSSESWDNYLGTVILAESVFVGIACGLLVLNALLIRRMDSPGTDGGLDPHRERHAGLSLCVSGGLILAMIVGWFIAVNGTFFPTPYIVLGVAIHALPFLAVLLCLRSPLSRTEPGVLDSAPRAALR